MQSVQTLRPSRTARLAWIRSTLLPISLVVAAVTVQSALGATVAEAAPASSAAYVSVQPCRLADTRLNSGFTRLDVQTMQIPARGICGIPSNATSLALTLTVDRPDAAGFLTAWPADQARPTVSNVNFNGSQIRANSSITRLDASGQLPSVHVRSVASRCRRRRCLRARDLQRSGQIRGPAVDSCVRLSYRVRSPAPAQASRCHCPRRARPIPSLSR